MNATTESLLNALLAIATQAENAARTFPNAPSRGDHLQVAKIARAAIASVKRAS